VKIKWPNDLYYENKKIGGILIESNIRSGMMTTSVAGIGINVNQESFTIPKASSLKKILGHELQRDSVFQKIISGIDKLYLQLQQNDYKSLKDRYLKNMYRYKEDSLFRSDKDFSGQIAGIDENGRLQVSSGGQIMSYGFKEIEFLD
jgi:BirA family transcriptional regulator, biotin operon repressor / biotin---[acetyl-CoA-carboxylase] ligase